MNGIEFLEAIRADQDLRSAVVFMITTFEGRRGRMRAYGHNNVAGYIVKRDPAKHLHGSGGAAVEHYWKVVEFPA